MSDPQEKDRGRAYVAWAREYQAQLQYFIEVAEQAKKVYDKSNARYLAVRALGVMQNIRNDLPRSHLV